MKAIDISNSMFNRIRKALVENNWNTDNAYQNIISEEGMFGYAYFGWSATPYQKKKMQHIWRAVLFLKYEECHEDLMPKWIKSSIAKFLEINN